MADKKKRVAIYARFSSNMQTEKSIEDQLIICRDVAAREGFEVVQVYADRALSGTSMLKRQQFLQLIEDAENGEFEVVMSEGLDRLSRDQADLAYFHKKMQFLDVGIYSIGDGGFIDEMHVAFKGYQHSAFIKDLGKKTRRGQVGTVRAGRISGSVAYGYRVVRSVAVPTGGREIDPEQAPIVVRIMEEYAAGDSTRAIASRLNVEGIPGPDGFLWRSTTILGSRQRKSGILRNDMYRGVYKWGKTQAKRDPVTGKKLNRVAPETALEIVDVPHLRIVSDELWNAVQTRLSEYARVQLQARRRPTYLLSKLTECEWCRKPYIMQDRGKCGCSGRLVHGICDNSRRFYREDLEEVVVSSICATMENPVLVDSYVREYAAAGEKLMEGAKAATSGLSQRIQMLARQERRLLSTISSGEVEGPSLRAVAAELQRISSEKEAAEAKLSSIPAAVLTVPNNVAERLKRQLADLRSQLYTAGAKGAAARELFRSLIDRVIISPADTIKADKRGSGPINVEIKGPIAALVGAAIESGPDHRAMLVAGTGFEPVTFRL